MGAFSPGRAMSWSWKGKTYTLPISDSDILTLHRAVDEEGFPKRGVAWALLQRAAWLHMARKTWTVGKLAEAYAQPINPLWFPDGSKHIAEVARQRRLGNEERAQDEIRRARSRVEKGSRPMSKIGNDTKGVIEKILAGDDKSPVIGAVHYWASRGPDFLLNQAKKPNLILLDAGYGFGAGRNVFFAAKNSIGFGGLKFKGGPGSGALQAPVGVAIALFAGMAAWKVFVER